MARGYRSLSQHLQRRTSLDPFLCLPIAKGEWGRERGGSCRGGGQPEESSSPRWREGSGGSFAPEPLSAAPRRGRGSGGTGGLRRAVPERGRRRGPAAGRWAPPDPKGRQRGWRPGAPGPQRKKAAGCGAGELG